MTALDGLSSAYDAWLQAGDRPRPFVTLSYAQSLDGSLTRQQGRPTALSGPQAIQLTHHVRAFHDAILIGSGTLLADDPQLTARDVPGDQPQPVVLDRRLRFPSDAKLLQHPNTPWILCDTTADADRAAQLSALGCEVVHTDTFDLLAVLAWLNQRGIRHLMVEGGGEVLTSFLRAGLADYAVVTIAPRLLGGYNAIRSPLASEADRMQTPTLTNVQSYSLGPDLIVAGRIEASPIT